MTFLEFFGGSITIGGVAAAMTQVIDWRQKIIEGQKASEELKRLKIENEKLLREKAEAESQLIKPTQTEIEQYASKKFEIEIKQAELRRILRRPKLNPVMMTGVFLGCIFGFASLQLIGGLKVREPDSTGMNNMSEQQTLNLPATANIALRETNSDFLQVELQKQMAQNKELERKFNDIVAVRAQEKKLDDDTMVASRLEWIKKEDDGNRLKKGAELLMQHRPAITHPTDSTQQKTNFDLNLEIGADGSVHIVQPTNNTETNALKSKH